MVSPVFRTPPTRRLLAVFFFQAEDGIRDWSVTGVQTCALPISVRLDQHLAPLHLLAPHVEEPDRGARDLGDAARVEIGRARVGKECRSGGAARSEEKTQTTEARHDQVEAIGWHSAADGSGTTNR